VICEACHGLNPTNHPPAEVALPTEAAMCGRCHESTFEEWRVGPHAVTETQGPIVCDTCHDPHTQQLRAPDIDTLCLDCHQSPPQDFAHTSHLEQQDLHCGGCHMYRDPDLGPCIGSLCETGHTMAVDTLACNDCHEDLSLRLETFTALTDPERLVLERENLQGQVADLEARLANIPPQPEPAPRVNFVQLSQGLIVGLGVGISLAWLLSRREGNDSDKKNNNGSGKAGPPDAEKSSEERHEQ
jgi:predicted CXXCH cytochrome family protein